MLTQEQHNTLVGLIQTLPSEVGRELQFAAFEGKPWETMIRIVNDFRNGLPVDSWDQQEQF
jgi:hypothetical protein